MAWLEEVSESEWVFSGDDGGVSLVMSGFTLGNAIQWPSMGALPFCEQGEKSSVIRALPLCGVIGMIGLSLLPPAVRYSP